MNQSVVRKIQSQHQIISADEQRDLLDPNSDFMKQEWSVDIHAMSIWGIAPWMMTLGVAPPVNDTPIFLEVCRLSQHVDPIWRRLNAQIIAQSLTMYTLIRSFYNDEIDQAEFRKRAEAIFPKVETPDHFVEPARSQF